MTEEKPKQIEEQKPVSEAQNKTTVNDTSPKIPTTSAKTPVAPNTTAQNSKIKTSPSQAPIVKPTPTTPQKPVPPNTTTQDSKIPTSAPTTPLTKPTTPPTTTSTTPPKTPETPPKQTSKNTSTKPTKKDEAVANGQNLRASRKQSTYICTFIKNKSVDKAISDLELVIQHKKAVPCKGETPHRKGMQSGRYPEKAAALFIKLLKGLKGSIITNGMELDNARITFASASGASRPARRGGRQFKRTNVVLKATEVPLKEAKK
jgi:large subunit ribosomal protein L22